MIIDNNFQNFEKFDIQLTEKIKNSFMMIKKKKLSKIEFQKKNII